MSEMQPPPDEPSFGHYWAWVAREKQEKEIYRLIRTTPGLVDRSHVVENIEEASKELVSRRKEHLQDLLDGWEIIERCMTKEVAIKIFNEFIAGCRTLEDFERLNFSKKNKDQAKPRNEYAQHLNGTPILSWAPIRQLEKNGALPSTSIVYSPTTEFFHESTTDKYYELLFGDAQVFHAIMKKFNPSPNMPPAKAIPMPYHPNMDKQDKDFVKWHQVVTPYTPVQPQMFTQPPPPIQYALPYNPMQYMQMPIQMQPMALPMAMPQETVYLGSTYQKSQQNGYYGNNRSQQRNGQPYKPKNNRNDQYTRNDYDNYENAPSTSAQAAQAAEAAPAAQPVETTQRPPMLPYDESTLKDAFPALDPEQVAAYVDVEVSVKKMPETAPAPVATVLSTPRKFSEVVSQKVSAPSSTVGTSEGSVAATVDEDRASANQSTRSAEETQSGSSDTRSVTSESLATTSDPTSSSSDSTAARTPTLKTEATPEALIVDTTEPTAPVVPPVSYRTVAEVVQQSLSAAPSPSAKRVNGVNSSQASPAVKSNTSQAANGSAPTSSRERTPVEKSGSEDRDKSRKTQRSPKKPSISYAQMLYPQSRESSKSSSTKKSSTASQSSSNSTSQQSSSSAPAPSLSTDWHTVKNKKAAEPVVLSPPLNTPEVVKKPPPKPVEPTASTDQEEEEVASDDPEAEKKREKRRQKRQKLKEANRVVRQHERDLARQESLARSAKIYGELNSSSKPPAFDRTDIYSRRRKRIQLQDNRSRREPTPPPPKPPKNTPKNTPLIPKLVPTGMGSAPTGASITAGQAAMAAYGLTAPFRHSSSPFSLLAKNGTASLPLFLPPQDGVVTNQEGVAEGILLEEVGDNQFKPLRLVRRLPLEQIQEHTEMDLNANMIEKILIFDALDTLKNLTMSVEERAAINRGLEDVKNMYPRVERAGQLVAFKAGSSKVNSKTEERLMTLAVKLLSNRSQLEEAEDKAVAEISKKIATCSEMFNYTNYLTALIDFGQDRAKDLPDGMALKKNYETTVQLTKLYLKRTKLLFDKISRHFDIGSLSEPEG